MQECVHVRTDNEYKQDDILFAVFFIRMTGELDILSYPLLISKTPDPHQKNLYNFLRALCSFCFWGSTEWMGFSS